MSCFEIRGFKYSRCCRINFASSNESTFIFFDVSKNNLQTNKYTELKELKNKILC